MNHHQRNCAPRAASFFREVQLLLFLLRRLSPILVRRHRLHLLAHLRRNGAGGVSSGLRLRRRRRRPLHLHSSPKSPELVMSSPSSSPRKILLPSPSNTATASNCSPTNSATCNFVCILLTLREDPFRLACERTRHRPISGFIFRRSRARSSAKASPKKIKSKSTRRTRSDQFPSLAKTMKL